MHTALNFNALTSLFTALSITLPVKIGEKITDILNNKDTSQ